MSKLTKIMEQTFTGETMEVGLYLAMARKAELDNLPEVATYLRGLAMEEAGHACEVAIMLSKIKGTKENLEYMLGGETMATKEKMDAARVAKEEGNSDAEAFFIRASADENRHRSGLQGFLNKMK
ncbi:MAG TPA: ferritin family protein [Methanocella sp.]|uniref:ferritin family protein n=1 Tax=Methanocella sp. TaxID=2052833 RepID=UPI002C900BD0|nr:ferritin family protein [Methanocella sp.]HTY91814.1 ferritin family protein [Methanocella sp.]